LAALAFKVQAQVLPKFGFDCSAKGVAAMRAETRAMFAADPELRQLHREINALLGLGDNVEELDIRVIETPRFDAADVEGWKAHLAAHGFVVLAQAASPDEVQLAWSLLWDFIEASDRAGQIRRGDVGTWGDDDRKDFGWPAGKADGIIHDRGIGQSELLWYIRGLPTLHRAFASIWRTDRLVTSFDGAGAFRPFGQDESWKTTKRHWYHVDQAHMKPGLHCIQGQVTLTDVTAATGGLVVVPGSHKFHTEVLRSYARTNWDYIALRSTDRILTEGGGPRLVAARAGDAILWDSRTIHCNHAAARQGPHPGRA